MEGVLNVLIMGNTESGQRLERVFPNKNQFQVLITNDHKTALSLLTTQSIDLVFSAMDFHAQWGFQILTEGNRLGINPPLILYSSQAKKSDIISAFRLGAFDFIEEPFQTPEVRDVIARALQRKKPTLKSRLEGLALSNRQIEIVVGLLQGRSNKEIASSINISEQGVKYHLGRLMKRYAALNRFELRGLIGALLRQTEK